jgi:hypothetical protein
MAGDRRAHSVTSMKATRTMPQRRGEQGGLTIEQVGIGAVVVALVASLIGTGLGGLGATVGDKLQTLVCQVAGQGCGGGGAPAGDVPAGPAPGQDGGEGAPVAGPDGGPGGEQPAGGQGQPDIIPLDNVQLAAAEATGIQTFAQQGGGGGGGGNQGSQEERLPRGGSHPFEPKKGQRLSEPVQCDPGGGGCLPRRKATVNRERDGSFVDKHGNRWQWDPVKGEWDVQHKDGTHTNVSPDGEVTHGPNNFPNKSRTEREGGDTAKVVVGGVTIGGALWWAAKLLSPACGPLAPACAVVL